MVVKIFGLVTAILPFIFIVLKYFKTNLGTITVLPLPVPETNNITCLVCNKLKKSETASLVL